MDPANVDLLIQYVLASSALEEFPNNQLGPIHVLKYVYLADLAHAEKHGTTYTGAEWLFYDFGPWSPAVHSRINDAAVQAGADIHRLESREGREFVEFVRYDFQDRSMRDRLERRLPIAASRAVDRAIKRFGSCTPDLLDFVYVTAPMRTSSPGETLVFPTSTDGSSTARDSGNERELTAKQQKRRKERVRALQERVKAVREGRAQAAKAVSTPPRYDAVFRSGRQWLDDQAPCAPDDTDAELVVDPSVWKSAMRTDGDVP